MLRLPTFEHHAPDSVGEAVALLAEIRARGEVAQVIAGGTDLLPNMKHEITTPDHLVSLHLLGLCGVHRDGDDNSPNLTIGAMTPIQTVADDPLVGEHLPALREACLQIAGPQLRRMGTLGGNICLDTRCLYINQTHFWRSALGFCLKKDGTACHVVAGGRRCVAAASNDSVLPLLLYGARVELHGPQGTRTLDLGDLFVTDGIDNTVIADDEILTRIRIPLPDPQTAVAFEKLRARKAIDFPLLNVAVLVAREASEAEATLRRCEIVVSALGARPKHLRLDKQVRGQVLDAPLIATLARKAHAACRPLTNIATDPQWRRAMIPVLVRRALKRL